MSDHSITFTVIVPTYDRVHALRRCLTSVADQTRHPEELVVVADTDAARTAARSFADRLPAATTLHVTATDGPPGSSTARNTGIRLASQDVVVILDDDTELGPSYLERLAAAYRRHDSPRLAGIGGVDPNDLNTTAGGLWFDLFYKGGPWRINRAGMSTLRPDDSLANGEPTRTDWLIGNNMSFDRDVIEDHLFPQWGTGREPHEDLAVGWSLKNDGYHCVLDPALPVEHHRTPTDDVVPERWVAVGANRVHNFRHYGNTRDLPLFAWAMAGEILQQFIVRTASVGDRLTRAASILYGVVAAATIRRTSPSH